MSKKKFLKIVLMAFIFAFGLFISGVAAEEECWDCPGGGPTLSGDHIYPWWWVCTADPYMEYDTENSAETVGRNGSATISVIGNNAPYIWTISGTGFSLENATTTGLTNTLNAAGTACGAATITVTGCDGTSVTGYVRCTTGVWSSWSYNVCVLSGEPDTKSYAYGVLWLEKTVGKYNMHQKIAWVGPPANVPCDSIDCTYYCGFGACLDGGLGCYDCLDWECSDVGHGGQPWCCDACMCTQALMSREWVCY